MNLGMHANYRGLIEKARHGNANHRSPTGITADDVARARLYCYAFRLHTIGAFHATRLALSRFSPPTALFEGYRIRAVEALHDLANQAMDPVPRDFRAVLATLYRYHQGVERVLDSLRREEASAGSFGRIPGRFQEIIEEITTGPGIHLARDTEAPEQASFVVPNLGIVIVPLVYGDQHSWNLAWLGGRERDVPIHRHHQGVEIHLGYRPIQGMTVLGRCRAAVDEGYAMPIPPETDHGWANLGDVPHHVPFVFGSLKCGGWGVFLDVEPQTCALEQLTPVDRQDEAFRHMVFLEREIEEAATRPSGRKVLIPYIVTDRTGCGGLELAVTCVGEDGYELALDEYRTVSVVRGAGVVSMAGLERPVTAHDHFGVPAGMRVGLRQIGHSPLVVLDALIKGEEKRRPDLP